MLQKIFIVNKLLKFLFIKESWFFFYHCFRKNIKQHKDDVTLKIGVMTAEYTALPSQE